MNTLTSFPVWSCLGSSWHWPGTSLVETYIDSSAIRKLSWVARQPFLPLQYISRNMIWLMIRVMILWLIIILISLPIGSKYGRFTYIFMRSFSQMVKDPMCLLVADLWAIHGYSNWGEHGLCWFPNARGINKCSKPSKILQSYHGGVFGTPKKRLQTKMCLETWG